MQHQLRLRAPDLELAVRSKWIVCPGTCSSSSYKYLGMLLQVIVQELLQE